MRRFTAPTVFLIALLTVITLAASHCGSEGAVGDTFELDFIEYKVTSEGPVATVEVAPPTSGSYSGVITIPETVQNGKEYTVTAIGANAFAGCTTLTKVTLPANLLAIGQEAFAGCSIAEADIPSGVNHIGNGAFKGCTALTDVIMPYDMGEIADNLFDGCTSLENVRLPHAPTRIGNYAFRGCIGVTSATLPSVVTEIGTSAFEGTGLKLACLPDSVTVIGKSAFAGCQSLEFAMMSRHMDAISDNAFKGCANLKSVIFANHSTIGAGAFENCTTLSSVYLHDGLVQIGDRAFAGCTSLKALRLPDSADTGSDVFYGCNSASDTVLKSITIASDSAMVENGFFQKYFSQGNWGGLTGRDDATVRYINLDYKDLGPVDYSSAQPGEGSAVLYNGKYFFKDEAWITSSNTNPPFFVIFEGNGLDAANIIQIRDTIDYTIQSEPVTDSAYYKKGVWIISDTEVVFEGDPNANKFRQSIYLHDLDPVDRSRVPKKYTLSFNTNGNGETILDTERKVGLYDETRPPYPNNAPEGKVFKGWSVAGVSGCFYDQSVKTFTATEDETVHLKAIWGPKSVDIMYNGSGGYITPSSAGLKSVYTGTLVPHPGYDLPAELTAKEAINSGGVSFDRFFYNSADGTVFIRNGIIESEIGFFGDFVPKRYTVNLSNDPGTSSYTAVFGSGDMPGFSTPSKNGYRFQGYWTDPSAGDQVITPSGAYSDSDLDDYISGGTWIRDDGCTLYARWAKATVISPPPAPQSPPSTLPHPAPEGIIYRGNGGACGSEETWYGNNAVDFSKVPERSGYRFLGWSPDAYATVPLYTEGTAHMATGTLFAVWEADPATGGKKCCCWCWLILLIIIAMVIYLIWRERRRSKDKV